MGKRLIVVPELLVGVLCLLLGAAVCVLGLSGLGGGTVFMNTGCALDNCVELPDLHVSVHTPSEVRVGHPFSVTATIASPHPLSSSLDQITRPPPSYTGSYSLCLIVDLQLDDPSAFGFAQYSESLLTDPELTVVPDLTTAQIAQWTLTPEDTFGVETVPHEATVRVWFVAKSTCSPGVPFLAESSFLEVGSSRSSAPPAQFTVVNDALRHQRAIAARLQPLAVAAVAAGTTASLGWATGFFAWVQRRLGVRRKQDASENVTPRRAAPRSGFIVLVPGGALWGLGMGLILLGPSMVPYSHALGTGATLGSFYVGMVVACAGIVVLARGVRRLRSEFSA